jgi:hypothetical protein
MESEESNEVPSNEELQLNEHSVEKAEKVEEEPAEPEQINQSIPE